MARILSENQCQRIRALQKQFKPFEEKGWMCEGSEYGDPPKPCNAIFNNDTDEWFLADYEGVIVNREYVSQTPEKDLEEMAKIQGEINKVADE